ncbi:MAG: flippase [Candidatus Hodarchaeota archaeon]
MTRRPASMESIKLKKLATNYTFLSGGELISKICTFVAFVYLARVLSPQYFGYLEFTLAIMVFFNLFVDFGSSPYGAREIAKDKKQLGIISANIVALRVLFAIAGYLLLIALVLFLPNKDFQIRRLILIYGITLFGIPGFLQWIFQGFDKMKWVALGSIIRQLLFVIGVFLLIRHVEQLWFVALVECIAVVGYVLYNFYIFRSRFGQFIPQISLGSLKNSFLQAMPIGLSELTWAITWYIPTILLGFIMGGKMVGWFSAAHRPVMTLHAFIWLYFFNMLPSLSRCSTESKKNLHKLMTGSLRLSAWVSVFFGISCTILADHMIRLVYGDAYSQTIFTFKILVWVLPIALLSGHYRYALIAFNYQRDEFIASLCAAVISLVLGVVLIPRFAVQGAAMALLTAAVVNWIVAYKFVQKKIGRITFMNYILRPMIAGCTMIIGFLLLLPLNMWLASAGGIMLFGFALAILQPEVKKRFI